MAASLYIREIGVGKPVLLLPGCPVPADHLVPLARELSNDRRVLLPDLPGYGDSPRLVGRYTLSLALSGSSKMGCSRAARGRWRSLGSRWVLIELLRSLFLLACR